MINGGEAKPDSLSVNRNNSTSVPQSPSDYQFPTSLSMQRNNSSNAQIIPPKRPSTTISLQALNLHSSPTELSDSMKPKLSRMSSMNPVTRSSPSRKQKHNIVKSALAVPVHVPVMQNEVEVVKFLTSNYLIEVPNGMSITQICEHNATVAGSAQRFKDCQTWRTIRESIFWEQSEQAVGMDDYQSVMSGSHITSHLHDDPQQRRNHSTVTYDSHTTTGASVNDQLGTSLGSMSGSSVSHYKSGHPGSFSLGDSHIKAIAIQRREVLSNLVSDVESRSNSKTTFDSMSDGVIDPNENAVVDDDDATTTNTNSRSNSKTDDVNMSRTDAINEPCNYYVPEKQVADSPESIVDYIPPAEIINPMKKFNRSGSSSSTGKFRFSFSAASVDFDNEKPVNLSKSPKSSLSSSILVKSSGLQFGHSLRQTARLEPASSVSMDMSPVKKPPFTSATRETNTSEGTLAPTPTVTVTNESRLTAGLRGPSGNSTPRSRSPVRIPHHHHNEMHHHQHQHHRQHHQHSPPANKNIEEESNLGDDENQGDSSGSDTDSLRDSDRKRMMMMMMI
ncbi:unnamed protein product [Ambrosiozyma monospora]|uniref:Unnamed protein product n=1 Tax=Ambrosiozyma monospora TaxID=43982 RepID=A0ACB5TJD8_AMBMO|nr:unnamed protein product [Ambrosiozyma monospora]